VQIAGETVVQTVVVEKDVVEKEVEVAGETVVQTVVVEKEVEVVVTATPGAMQDAAAPRTQTGEFVAALQTVGLPVGTPELCVPTCSNEQYYYSVWDTPVQWSADGRVIPAVAESWELAPDKTSFTWHIRPGIQFHKDWGEVTAEDFAWSTNTVNANVNPETLHDVSGDLVCCYGETVAVDRYTAVTEIIKYDSRAPGWLFSNLRDAYGISSKTIYDELGKEGMRNVFVGTGPFEIRQWRDNDKIILDALPEHYNQAAHIASARILEVPEEASRIAMFESGDAMVTHVSLPNTIRLEEAGGVRRLLQTVILHAGMNPNFLERTNPKTGEPLVNPGYDEAKKNPENFPWVSFYDLPGSDCDWNVLLEEVPSNPDGICPEMENARKVRWAMAKAIDKQALAESIYDGLAWQGCNWAISANDPLHDDAWCVPYDVEGAKALMAEAGVDGFTIGWWAGNEPSEAHQAIASMWKDVLNIHVDFHLGPFTTWHPTFVDRSFIHLVHDGEQGGMPAHFAKGREAQAWFAGGIMWSGGIPFYQRIYGDMLGEEDIQKRNEMAVQFGNHEAFWHWDPATVEFPVYTVYNKDLISWNPQKTAMHTAPVNMIYPLEDIVIK
jgi:ABC-type transport system substrate-binding protein